MDNQMNSNSPSNERPILPPISTMGNYLESRSWPPPATSLFSSTNLLSPSTVSSDTTMQETSLPSLNLSPNRNEEHYQPRSDYFNRTPLFRNNSNNNNNNNNSANIHTQQHSPQNTDHHYNHHYRQSSLPQLGLSKSIDIKSSTSQFSPTGPQPSSFIAANSNIAKTSTPSTSSLTSPLTSPSIKNVENDMEQVVKYCNSLVDNMNERKHTIKEDENYFNDSAMMKPWLDDMVKKANEILNALLRLRKYQMLAEQTRVHQMSNYNQQDINMQDNDGWPMSTSSNIGSIISLNSGRSRKRGKRPAFQGRCRSCNISETPEWRRGPDGARTLCNACGLHYAKLTKKKNKLKVSLDNKDDTNMT